VIPGLEEGEPAEEEIEYLSDEIKHPPKNVNNKIDNKHGVLL
jgi:hypothetical protein